MARDLDVICLGEALVDLLPDRRGSLRDCEAFTAHSGGAPANVAVGLARLGLRVAFAGVTGDDELGRLLERKLRGEGIELHFRFTAEARTGLWFVALDAKGDRSFFTPTGAGSADKLVTAADLPASLLERARVLHCGSSSHIRPAGQEALRAAVRAARGSGVEVSFDPNVRAHLWEDLRDLRALCDAVLPFCDVVKLSADETDPCVGEADPERALDRLAALGVRLGCVTLGADGALARHLGRTVRVPSPRVEVEDTTGAGDGFVAGLLGTLLRESPSIAEAPLAQVERALDRACRTGARVCTRPGAISGLPTLAELDQL